MAVSTILSVLLATLLSDSVTCGRVRRTEYGPAKDAGAPEVSPSHGRTFVNFDSSPALTHLEFNRGPSNVHHRGVHGVPVVPPKPAEPSWELGEYDYAEYDQNYPHWHQVHPFHGPNVNAAPTLWPDFNELRQMTTKQPPSAHSTDAGRRTVDLSEFDPTHSFFGSMFTDSSDTGKGTKSSPPVASTTQAIGSSADKDSPSKSTTPGEESQAVSTTSVQLQESHGDHGKALKDGAPFATTVIESLLQQGVGSTATPTLSSPTVGNKSTETTNPSVGTTSTATGVAQGSSEPPTKPDAPRETGSTRGSAAVPVDSSTTVSFREPGFTDTHPKFSGSEAAHTGVTSTATGTDSKFTSSTVPASPADLVARQADAGTVASSSKPTGGFVRLPTPPEAGGADKIVETTTERTFPNATTGSRPLAPQASANETEIPARQPVFKDTPPDNTSQASPSVLESTEPSKLATSPRETQTPVQHVDFRNKTSDFPATPATATPFAVSEVAGLSNRLETTTHSSLATSTAPDGRLQNRATSPLTRAPVEDSNETSTVSQRPVEPSTVRPTSPAITAGVRQATTTPTSSPTTTEPTRAVPTAQGGLASPAQPTLARNAAFKQTLPNTSRPVHPATTASPPPVTADAYVRPITQHGVHEFVPQRHRDVEDYFYHHQSGRVEDDDDQLRRSPCGKCQRRLHYCVQKCFVHHSCEAETNPELTCPRINAPCMPPYKHEVDQCRHSADCESANHLCCLVGCSRRCVHGVPTQH